MPNPSVFLPRKREARDRRPRFPGLFPQRLAVEQDQAGSALPSGSGGLGARRRGTTVPPLSQRGRAQ